MELRIWGTRGAFVAPGAQFVRHGGATACAEIIADGGGRLILDLGTGGINLGSSMMSDTRPRKVALLLSHTQFDHIMGLPFFVPAFMPGFEMTVMGPSLAGEYLSRLLDRAFYPDYSPLYSIDNLHLRLRTVAEGDLFWEGIRIRTREVPHEGSKALGFRIEVDGKVLAAVTDIAWDAAGPPAALFDLASGADLLIHDSMGRSPEPSRARHPTAEDAARSAAECGAKSLLLYHHHPDATDDALDAALAELRGRGLPFSVESAREGGVVRL